MNVDYFSEIAKEISILYEISLSIGRSLNLKTNCELFLKTLMTKKGLTYGAIWVRDKYLGGAPGCESSSLVFAHPDYYVREKTLPLSHPLFSGLREETCFSCSSDDDDFETFVTEKGISQGALAFFSLGDIGFLKLFSGARKKAFEQKQMNQLRNVLSKFTVSLEGCLAHERSLREVEERKNAEKLLQVAQTMLEARVAARTSELEESRVRLSSILNTIGDGIVVTSLTGEILSCNRACLDLYGYSEDEIQAKNFRELFPIDKRKKLTSDLQSLIEKGNIHFESEAFRKDGSLFPVEVTESLMKGATEVSPSAVVVLKDITERRTLEEEMRKAHKLESLGVLAGGIAHDFNNLLAGILGNASLEKHLTDPKDKKYRRLDNIEKAAERARDLTQQLLTFSRGGKPVKKTTSIEQIVMDSASFVLRGSNIRCEFIIPDSVWPVEVDEGQMNQVFNNLIINADQAMPAGGNITIQIENLPTAPKDILTIKEGEYVKISVRDHGVGICEEILQKIFDPYFTTKQRGSGLGLAIVYSIINNHGGYISVESRVGMGTTFHVYIPASKMELPVAAQPVRSPLAGSGKILIMDDEEILREVACEMLSHLGYHVVACGDGAEAIELYREAMVNGEPFVAVIVDLTIPGGMGGKETMKKLLEIDSEVMCVVSSGYCNDPILAYYGEYGFSGVVVKPYNMETLGKVLHELFAFSIS
jgi:PAS domain S-box-containing protein